MKSILTRVFVGVTGTSHEIKLDAGICQLIIIMVDVNTKPSFKVGGLGHNIKSTFGLNNIY